MANLVIGADGEVLEYCHLMTNPKTSTVWSHSYGRELSRLAQGMPGQNTGTDTIVFNIRCNQVPRNRTKDITYGLITCLVRPEKNDEPNRMRIVAGGNRVHYPDARTPTTNLLTIKLLINSTISTVGAKFMTMDIKDFYLYTPMARYKYMRLKLTDIPADLIEHYKYNLHKIAMPDGYVYCKIQKGM
jgi:hypothetical protein